MSQFPAPAAGRAPRAGDDIRIRRDSGPETVTRPGPMMITQGRALGRRGPALTGPGPLAGHGPATEIPVTGPCGAGSINHSMIQVTRISFLFRVTGPRARPESIVGVMVSVLGSATVHGPARNLSSHET